MNLSFAKLYWSVDAFLIFFYRLTGIPMIDYLLGTLNLCLLAVVLGELTISLGIRINRRYTDKLGAEADRMEKLSIAAYEAGDKAGYRALNQAATDSWGKHFFTMAAYSAGLFWPIPFALHWMQYRFGDVVFPVTFPFSLVTDGVGFLFSFFPLYILARMIFKRLRPWLPYFRGVQKMSPQRRELMKWFFKKAFFFVAISCLYSWIGSDSRHIGRKNEAMGALCRNGLV